MPRYLTKSRFILALECETKLFYTGKAEYADHKKDDPFLSALAEGGFQVGELAKLYYPGGHEIETLNHQLALKHTDELLQRDSMILYEAAIRHENLFLRADILIKKGTSLELIEVKSKSFRGSSSQEMLNKDGTINRDWTPYLYDVAFQKHVLSLALPQMQIRSSLLLADKNARATVDGLNQRFFIYKQNGRSRVRVREGTTREMLGEPILIRVPVDDVAEKIYQGRDGSSRDLSFSKWVDLLADCYGQDRKIPTELGSKCKGCEFMQGLRVPLHGGGASGRAEERIQGVLAETGRAPGSGFRRASGDRSVEVGTKERIPAGGHHLIAGSGPRAAAPQETGRGCGPERFGSNGSGRGFRQNEREAGAFQERAAGPAVGESPKRRS